MRTAARAFARPTAVAGRGGHAVEGQRILGKGVSETMKKSLLSAFLLAAVVVGGLALMSPAPKAAPQCVDPDTCPDIICPPGHEFVPTTCKECGHCERIKGCKGKRPCETPL